MLKLLSPLTLFPNTFKHSVQFENTHHLVLFILVVESSIHFVFVASFSTFKITIQVFSSIHFQTFHNSTIIVWLYTILGFCLDFRSIYNFRFGNVCKIVFSLKSDGIYVVNDGDCMGGGRRHREINSCGAEPQLPCTGAVTRATFSPPVSNQLCTNSLTFDIFFSLFQYFLFKKRRNQTV